jgi:hypothetical protein
MGMRTVIGFLTRRTTYLVRMVDLSSMSRHGPSRRPQPFGIAVCSLISVPVVQHTFVQILTRFNESAQHWGWPLYPYNMVTELTYSPDRHIYENFGKDCSCVFLVRRRKNKSWKVRSKGTQGITDRQGSRKAARVCWLRARAPGANAD